MSTTINLNKLELKDFKSLINTNSKFLTRATLVFKNNTLTIEQLSDSAICLLSTTINLRDFNTDLEPIKVCVELKTLNNYLKNFKDSLKIEVEQTIEHQIFKKELVLSDSTNKFILECFDINEYKNSVQIEYMSDFKINFKKVYEFLKCFSKTDQIKLNVEGEKLLLECNKSKILLSENDLLKREFENITSVYSVEFLKKLNALKDFDCKIHLMNKSHWPLCLEFNMGRYENGENLSMALKIHIAPIYDNS